MIYEGTIQYVIIDKNGNDKTIKESFIINDVETFSEAEEKLYKECGDRTAFEVLGIKRSKVIEIANQRTYDEDVIYQTVLNDIFTDDNGEEKTMKYNIILYANSIEKAYSFTKEYISQRYEMEMIGLKKTKFIDVI